MTLLGLSLKTLSVSLAGGEEPAASPLEPEQPLFVAVGLHLFEGAAGGRGGLGRAEDKVELARWLPRAWVRVRVRVKVTGLEDKVESHVGSLVPWRKL